MSSLEPISSLIHSVNGEAIREDLFHLAEDPIPCRTLNYTRPGRDQCTLYDVDDLILGVLDSGGYDVTVETVPVQALVPDTGVPWGFRKPVPDEPWYEARNLQALKVGTVSPSQLVVILAHKDSQSWLECGPGAYDNAVGVAALLEISRLLAPLELARSVMLLFCNEEHWPWTSVEAAQALAKSNYDVVAVLNLDSIGGKSAADITDGRLPAVVRFSSREGERLADMIADVNRTHRIGLAMSKVYSAPNDDDGSFVNAGISPSVLLIGSFPYADPNYHTVDDKPALVDVENVRRSTQLALATVLSLCGLVDRTGL